MGFILDGLDSEAYDRQYGDRELLRRVLGYFRPHSKRMLLVAVALTLNSLAGSAGQFINQVKGVLFTMAYAGGVTFLLVKIIDKVLGLRISEEEETLGLDLSQHGESAYND